MHPGRPACANAMPRLWGQQRAAACGPEGVAGARAAPQGFTAGGDRRSAARLAACSGAQAARGLPWSRTARAPWRGGGRIEQLASGPVGCLRSLAAGGGAGAPGAAAPARPATITSTTRAAAKLRRPPMRGFVQCPPLVAGPAPPRGTRCAGHAGCERFDAGQGAGRSQGALLAHADIFAPAALGGKRAERCCSRSPCGLPALGSLKAQCVIDNRGSNSGTRVAGRGASGCGARRAPRV